LGDHYGGYVDVFGAAGDRVPAVSAAVRSELHADTVRLNPPAGFAFLAHTTKEDDMAQAGLQVFDKTVHTTNAWLDEIVEELGPSKQNGWHALGAVLRTLRDRLPLDLAVHLGAQLARLVRGLVGCLSPHPRFVAAPQNGRGEGCLGWPLS
jgi:hypothetical protein